jgi:nitrite reductase/ring-hydroxylating ferredoxin subunit
MPHRERLSGGRRSVPSFGQAASAFRRTLTSAGVSRFPRYHQQVLDPRVLSIPTGLQAPGTARSRFEAVADLDQLPPGALLRVTRGDLDILLAHTEAGILATDDRCPHMSAPLSQGTLDGCLIDCPLHAGRFDLATGATLRFPTTGGLDPEGGYHPTWQPSDRPPRPEPTDAKARARASIRVRRLRYYTLRVRAGRIEVAFPRP